MHSLSGVQLNLEEEAYVKGILGVYELNRIDLIRDVFVWAYRRSCIQKTSNLDMDT